VKLALYLRFASIGLLGVGAIVLIYNGKIAEGMIALGPITVLATNRQSIDNDDINNTEAELARRLQKLREEIIYSELLADVSKNLIQKLAALEEENTALKSDFEQMPQAESLPSSKKELSTEELMAILEQDIDPKPEDLTKEDNNEGDEEDESSR
jgi:hypothetical protein